MLKIAWSNCYNHPVPDNHRFPMLKYDLLPEQLLHEGTITPDQLFEPSFFEEEIILKTHSPDYLNRLKNLTLSQAEIRRTGFELSDALIRREILILNGTLQCAHYALEYGAAMNVAGGTHHAFYDRGEGFCLLNDQAVAANYLLEKGLAKRILIIDLDVHQGNGTASIFAEEPRVFTFSMHGAANYPYIKEKSDLDVALADGTNDEHYLIALNKALVTVDQRFKPDFVFYQAGVDVLATDKLGRLSLSIAGSGARDQRIIEYCHQKGVPLVICMGGGYSPLLTNVLDAHAQTFRLIQQIYF